jgi:hypothetical protein
MERIGKLLKVGPARRAGLGLTTDPVHLVGVILGGPGMSDQGEYLDEDGNRRAVPDDDDTGAVMPGGEEVGEMPSHRGLVIGDQNEVVFRRPREDFRVQRATRRGGGIPDTDDRDSRVRTERVVSPNGPPQFAVGVFVEQERQHRSFLGRES